jgi:hypothetical protein
MWDFVVDKVAPGQVSSEYLVSPAKFIPPIAPKFIIIIIINQSIIGDMYNRPNGQTSKAAVQGPNNT